MYLIYIAYTHLLNQRLSRLGSVVSVSKTKVCNSQHVLICSILYGNVWITGIQTTL